jgi:hypothetical protein
MVLILKKLSYSVNAGSKAYTACLSTPGAAFALRFAP